MGSEEDVSVKSVARLSLSAFCLLVAAGVARAALFTPPARLSDGGLYNDHPDMVVDNQGNMNVVYEDPNTGVKGSDVSLTYSLDGGASWSTETVRDQVLNDSDPNTWSYKRPYYALGDFTIYDPPENWPLLLVDYDGDSLYDPVYVVSAEYDSESEVYTIREVRLIEPLPDVRNIPLPGFPAIGETLPGDGGGTFYSHEPFVSADDFEGVHVTWRMYSLGAGFSGFSYGEGDTLDLDGWYVYHPTPLTKPWPGYAPNQEVPASDFQNDFPWQWQLVEGYGEVPVYEDYVNPANWTYTDAGYGLDNFAVWYNVKTRPGGLWYTTSIPISVMAEAAGSPPAKVRSLDETDPSTYGEGRWFWNEASVMANLGVSVETHPTRVDVYALYSDRKRQGWWVYSGLPEPDDVESFDSMEYYRLRVATLDGVVDVVPYTEETIVDGDIDTTRQYGTDWNQVFVVWQMDHDLDLFDDGDLCLAYSANASGLPEFQYSDTPEADAIAYVAPASEYFKVDESLISLGGDDWRNGPFIMTGANGVCETPLPTGWTELIPQDEFKGEPFPVTTDPAGAGATQARPRINVVDVRDNVTGEFGAADGMAEIYVVWQDDRRGRGVAWDVYFQYGLVQPDGSIEWTDFDPNTPGVQDKKLNTGTLTYGSARYPNLYVQRPPSWNAGKAYFTWVEGEAGRFDVYVRAWDPDGSIWSNPTRVTSTSAVDRAFPACSVDSLGNMSLVWRGADGGGGNEIWFSKNYVPEVTGVRTTSGDGWVLVQWNYTPGAATYEVYRSTVPSPNLADYEVLAELVEDDEGGPNGAQYLDTTVTNYTRYWYKVVAFDSMGRQSYESEPVDALPLPGGGGGGGGGCFIATAAYGSPMADEVESLRRFRDDYLLTNPLGRAFVRAYYEYGPFAADAIRDNELARAIARTALRPLVELSKSSD